MIWYDIKYAFRQLLKTPGFTVIAVLTLTLGIGINTALFSMINTVILKQLPYDNPEQLVQVWEDPSGQGTGHNSVSGGVFDDWREYSQCFQHMSALKRVKGNLTGGDQPVQLVGAQVSAGFFEMLRVQPALGRTFLSEEDQPGHHQVVILNHAVWQLLFAADPSIVGRSIQIDGLNYTVIGVLPAGFQFPSCEAQYWVPFGWGSAEWHHNREMNSLRVFARLNPGVTAAQAQTELNTVIEQLKSDYPNYKSEWGATVNPLSDALSGFYRLPLLALMGAVSFVLLIACVNVVNLILVRTAGRQTELALRIALGAGRWRLMCQLLVESFFLAVIGGTLGVLLAFWGTPLLVAFSPQDMPRLQDVRVDASVLVFALALSLLAGILCGWIPAWLASRLQPSDVLKEGGRNSIGGNPRRLSSGLVIAEVALATALTIGAGLFMRSFQQLLAVNPGFQSDGVLTMTLKLPETKYPDGPDRERFFQQVIEHIETLPGVEYTGVSTGLPFVGGHDNGVLLQGSPPSEYFSSDYDFVTPRYFQSLGIPLLQGRLFTDTDASSANAVTIVNETFVRKCLPNENPIGKRIIENGQYEMEIIGVVGDVRNRSLAQSSHPQHYKPMTATDWTEFNLFVRTKGDPLALASQVRQSILAVDPYQPVANIRSLDNVLFESISAEKALMVFSAGFAFLALLLASLGIYGVMTYAVTRRIPEIGIRMALGSRRSDMLTLILRQGMSTVVIGLTLGVCGTLILTRVLRNLLYGISPTDPVTIGVALLILAGVAAIACLLPALRASRIDPMEALRYE